MIMNKNSTKNVIRTPIITILGHIDHGKTTLLKYLYKSKKFENEPGNITQYIKPYYIKTDHGNMTFLDTPGHFAFNSIRLKSVKFSDIVLLIIAADDGIKPQTIESIDIAKKFKKSVIVVINKIDKIHKDNDKIVNELTKYNLTPEKWGGDTLMTYISAKTGEGINTLLELIKLQSEMLDLQSDITLPAEGFILDNKLDKGKGPVATIITLNGVLNKGDIVKIKDNFGKIKTISDTIGNDLKVGKLSIPLNITGLSSSIEVGEAFSVVKNIDNKITINVEKNRNIYDINELMKNIKNVKKEKLNIIVKADTQSSINVLNETLNKINNDKIDINILQKEIGNINKSDINFAETTNSIIIGFNIKCDSKIKKLSETKLIKINIFNIIYDVIDYIESFINKKLTNESQDNFIAIANVKKVFVQNNSNIIAGCVVTHGKIKQNASVKIFRKNIIIHKGIIDSIKMFKSDVKEVKAGSECGIIIKNYNNIQINDKIKVIVNKD